MKIDMTSPISRNVSITVTSAGVDAHSLVEYIYKRRVEESEVPDRLRALGIEYYDTEVAAEALMKSWGLSQFSTPIKFYDAMRATVARELSSVHQVLRRPLGGCS